MDDLAASVESHQNTIQTASGTVASIGLDMVGKKVAGALITPATWTLNYATSGSLPSAVDIGIYATAFVSAPASIITGMIKSVVDDDINSRLEEAKRTDDPKFAPFFKACNNYGYAPEFTNAMKVALSGGTAWQHPNGLWIYITDAKGKLVSDFSPRMFVNMFRPEQPLRAGGDGAFKWEVIKP